VVKKFIVLIERRKAMRQEIPGRFMLIVLLSILVLSVGGLGCSSTVKETQGEPGKSGERPIPPGAKYYSFEDILIPGELNYQPDDSLIYETPKFKMGRMIFTKYRLDRDSVIDFFSYHMEKDNWKLVNSIRGEQSTLNFSKPDKSCEIRVTENWLGKTRVEIRVGALGEKKM
jgi:hypothetical protein